MHGVEEAQREPRDGQSVAHFEQVESGRQVLRPDCSQHAVARHRGAVEFQHRYVDLPAAVSGLVPHGQAIAMQQKGQRGQLRQVARIAMQCDLDAVWGHVGSARRTARGGW
jgi:hypothetical protein